VTQPFVKLLAGEEEIATSDVSDKEFKIKGLSPHKLDMVDFKISLLDALGLMNNLNYQFPEEFDKKTLLGKAAWIAQHIPEIIQGLNMTYEVSTYADGVFIKDTEEVSFLMFILLYEYITSFCNKIFLFRTFRRCRICHI